MNITITPKRKSDIFSTVLFVSIPTVMEAVPSLAAASMAAVQLLHS